MKSKKTGFEPLKSAETDSENQNLTDTKTMRLASRISRNFYLKKPDFRNPDLGNQNFRNNDFLIKPAKQNPAKSISAKAFRNQNFRNQNSRNQASRKLPLAFAFALACFSSFTAFAAPKQVRAGVLNGPSGIPCAYLIENKDSFGIKNLTFENFTSAQTELPKLLKGEIDIGFLPPNAAAKVFNAGNGAVVCLGITGNGNLFVISKKSGVHALESLRGKTVQCAGQGATPEYMLKYLLSKQNIPVNLNSQAQRDLQSSKNLSKSENAVTLDFSIPNANIAAALISDKIEYALVPEPFATVAETKSPDVKRVLDIQQLFAYQNGGSYPMTLLVANAKFAKANKSTVEKFIQAYKQAFEWTVKNPSHAGALAEKNNLGLNAKIVEKAIPNAAFTWKSAPDGRTEIESLLSIFLENAPESVGGKLPADEFYFGEK
ncbi:MAG: ABC transporter substrate-binding protein [Treponema sp.]|nr:ABC transporter substrate-binding protein [Treponema sp.]